MNSLAEKLKALGVKVGAQDLPPPRPRDPYAIQQVVPGAFRPTPFGEIFQVERQYPLGYRQGAVGLEGAAPLRIIAEWAREPQLTHLESDGFAFLDTETTGLAGGTGTYAFLVGVGRFNGPVFHLAQFFMREPLEEPALLAALTEFLHPCQALVTFNGKAFDVPLLNARYISNGETPPLASVLHLDLLPLARRLWRDRLPSRALGYLEEHILGAARSEEDVPGWLIPNLYFSYLRSGDARPLKGVFYHNAMDILSLAALLKHVGELMSAPPETGSAHAVELVAMGRLHEDLGHIDTAVRLYQAGLAGDVPEDVYWDALRRLSLVHKRRGEWAAAISLWQQAAQMGHIYAHVELSKFYEHTARDEGQAAAWTEAALALVQSSRFPRSEARRWSADLEHRLARLRRKLDGAGS
jgi:hypothetical protein